MRGMKVYLEANVVDATVDERTLREHERIEHEDGREWGPGTVVKIRRSVRTIYGSEYAATPQRVIGHVIDHDQITLNGEIVVGALKLKWLTA